MSRCGSTLTANLMGSSPYNLVYSESKPPTSIMGLCDQKSCTTEQRVSEAVHYLKKVPHAPSVTLHLSVDRGPLTVVCSQGDHFIPLTSKVRSLYFERPITTKRRDARGPTLLYRANFNEGSCSQDVFRSCSSSTLPASRSVDTLRRPSTLFTNSPGGRTSNGHAWHGEDFIPQAHVLQVPVKSVAAHSVLP